MKYQFLFKFVFICLFLVPKNEGMEFDLEDIEVVGSPEYIVQETLRAELNIGEDRNSVSVYMELKKDAPSNAIITGSILGLSQGEYEIETGLAVTLPICEAIVEQVIVAPIMAAFGFFEDECPPKKGKYSVKNYYPNLELLPDNFPLNKYLLRLDVWYEGESLLTIKIFAEVI